MNVLFYKNILMLEYGNVCFNWLEDFREYEYFLQLLLLNVSNRNLFSCRQFETSSRTSCLRVHSDFGYMSMANFSWRYKDYRFVMFAYGGAVRIISHTKIAVSFFDFFISKHNWRELCCWNSSCFEMIGCGYNIFAW